MPAYQPDLQELTLKLDTRIVAELKQYVTLAHLCGTDLSSLLSQTMLRIVKAMLDNKTELKLVFKSDDPNYRSH